jgi:hypothetical protein
MIDPQFSFRNSVYLMLVGRASQRGRRTTLDHLALLFGKNFIQ